MDFFQITGFKESAFSVSVVDFEQVNLSWALVQSKQQKH